MSSPVQFSKYNWAADSAVARYLTDRTVGGGPVVNLTIEGVDIETPLHGMWEELVERLVNAYVHEQGASWAGGFYVFRDLVQPAEDPAQTVWWDLTLLTDPEAMDADAFAILNELNQTTTSGTDTCCMLGPRADGVNIAEFMTGLGRAVVYRRDAAGAIVVQAVYEGAVRRGDIAGFGRMIRDNDGSGTPDSFIGWSDGYEQAAGRYVYYRDFDLLYMGKKHGPYTEPPEDAFVFDTFEGNEGSEEALEESVAEQQ